MTSSQCSIGNNMKKLACLMALLPAIILCSCSKEQKTAAAQTPPPPTKVRAAIATTRSVPLEIATFGTAKPLATVTVKSEISGIVSGVHFAKGQSLRKGQLLFTIDPRMYQAAVDKAQANVDRNAAIMSKAQRDFTRTADLLKKGAATQDELENSQTTLDTIKATVRAEEAALALAKLDLERCSILCPIEGQAGNLLMDAGNLVKANDQGLVTINQLNPIDVFFSIPQSEIAAVRARLSEGLTMQACPPEQQACVEQGRLTFIDNTIDPSVGTIMLAGRFDNPQHRLWPGQYLLVKLTLATMENAVVIPSKAVETGRDGKYVYVIGAEDIVELRPVKSGQLVGDMVLIQEGLESGEVVVTEGQMKLKNQQKVSILPQPSTAPSATAPAGKTVLENKQ